MVTGCSKSPTGAHHWDISSDGVGVCRYCKETKQFPTDINDALKGSGDKRLPKQQKQEKQPDDHQPKLERRHYKPRKKHEDTRISLVPLSFNEALSTIVQIPKSADEAEMTPAKTGILAEGAPVPVKYSWEQWETETLALLEQIGLEIDELEKEQRSIIKRLQRLRSAAQSIQDTLEIAKDFRDPQGQIKAGELEPGWWAWANKRGPGLSHRLRKDGALACNRFLTVEGKPHIAPEDNPKCMKCARMKDGGTADDGQ